MRPKSTEHLPMLVGHRAASAYRELLLTYEGIQQICVCRYRPAPFLQQRIELSTFEQLIVKSALEIRAIEKIPFWEAVFAACLKSRKITDALLDAAMLHQGQGDISQVSMDEVRDGALETLAGQSVANVAISSEVCFQNGNVRHLGFLDLHCEISPDNTRIVSEVCRRIMPGGFVLLDSGDSYHVCGIKLLTDRERVEFLGRSLFFAPIVDAMYVAHQLVQSASSIRISSGGKQHKHPTVVSVCLGQEC
jgi:hypothetical protein